MNTNKFSSDLASIFKQSRRAVKLKRIDFAQKLGISLDELISIERGDNVGLHVVLSALNAIDLQLKVEEILPENIQVVENFDDYYQKRFRLKLENNARNEPKSQGFLEPADRKRMSILNLKKAFNI